MSKPRTFEQIMEQIKAESPAIKDMASWEDMAIDTAMSEAAAANCCWVCGMPINNPFTITGLCLDCLK
jgi:hypothetical protein